MRTRAWLLGTVAVLCFGLAGCDSSDDDSAPSPLDTTLTMPEHSAALVDAPAEGTCWRIPADNVADDNYWFDDSRQVPCSKPHTAETVDVLRLNEASVVDARQAAGLCWDRVRVYVGVDLDDWVPWTWAAFLPSGQQVADGANWMRCDAVFPGTWDFTSVRTTTGSARGVAKDPRADFWACLDEHPQQQRQQPFVPCDQPHQYEQTGSLALIQNLEGVQQYPSPAELEAAAGRQCAYTVEDRNDVALTAAWDPRAALREGTEIAGACFMFSKDGQPLPPLR
jgi:hypothetical protein